MNAYHHNNFVFGRIESRWSFIIYWFLRYNTCCPMERNSHPHVLCYITYKDYGTFSKIYARYHVEFCSTTYGSVISNYNLFISSCHRKDVNSNFIWLKRLKYSSFPSETITIWNRTNISARNTTLMTSNYVHLVALQWPSYLSLLNHLFLFIVMK